jgi:hypothetical protein
MFPMAKMLPASGQHYPMQAWSSAGPLASIDIALGFV